MKQPIFLIAILAMLMSCRAPQNAVTSAQDAPVATPNAAKIPSPSVLIYKTTKDYSQHVPVILTEDKREIASYPDPRDIYTNGKLALPTPLADGYWLDNRGISKNVAFLRYTYQEYAQLTESPSVTELYESIIDKNPLTILWNCGARHQFQNIENELNTIIQNGQLEEKFQKIK